jgi:AsmA family
VVEPAKLSNAMIALRKWPKLALALVVLVVVAQIGASFLVRTRRVHDYLVAHLTRAFGRPVEVEQFSVQILPSPSFDADRVTVGEDPGFGNEYFLRAERLTAGLRWLGLLRGHFDFGTVSLSRPSLILVRNDEGRWNLERWLPPAKSSANARVYGPPAAPETNRLLKIEFDDGRVNFKTRSDKLPFAFTGVSGSVEQVSPGRWQLQLEAQPWRSGVSLQSAGTLKVSGDLAGTSTRLQPAQISLHWDRVSLADLSRLARGQDYGLRGEFSLDATAKSGNSVTAQPGDWTFSVQALASQIHRWDLIERTDNPRLNLTVQGRWNVAVGSLTADKILLQSPASNLLGAANFSGGETRSVELRVDSLGLQAADLLAWYRAFHPDVAEGLSVQQFFTGGVLLRGWPLRVDSAGFSSTGGILKVPGLTDPIHIGPVRAGLQRDIFAFDPVRIALGTEPRDALASKKHRAPAALENAADVTILHNWKTQQGSINIEGRLAHVEDALKISSAFGKQLNHGWELTGEATAATHWEWNRPFKGRWNGTIDLSKSQLVVAGLNQPLNLQDAQLSWDDGQPAARLTRVEGFGGTWSGSITQINSPDPANAPQWRFDLLCDHLDASELDRWVGPRARPTWVQRLLTSLLGGSAPRMPASELVRRVNANGQLRLGQLTIEKLTLANVRAEGSLHDLHLDIRDAEADWAGGKVHAKVNATFSPRPEYDLTANLDNVKLSDLPPAGHLVEKLAGFASGTLHFATTGVGRDELLRHLEGGGDVHFKNVEFRGWDLNASVADGTPHPGISKWSSGHGVFALRDRSIQLESLRLDAAKDLTLVNGTVSFAREADLSIETANAARKPAPKEKLSAPERVLKISGPLDVPRVSTEKPGARQPAD